jgi:hypothetical protein
VSSLMGASNRWAGKRLSIASARLLGDHQHVGDSAGNGTAGQGGELHPPKSTHPVRIAALTCEKVGLSAAHLPTENGVCTALALSHLAGPLIKGIIRFSVGGFTGDRSLID